MFQAASTRQAQLQHSFDCLSQSNAEKSNNNAGKWSLERLCDLDVSWRSDRQCLSVKTMTGRSYIKRSLRQSAGDVVQILKLVEEAEKLPWPDKKELGDVYAVAMNAIGPLPLQTAPEEYGELCVRRLLVLCHVDLQEARTFNKFLEFYGIRQEPGLAQWL
eukprot:Skav230557  [mRNA]  locus=scaffold1482:6983:9205:- [translate_table: standard]